MNDRPIALASDHAGFAMKQELKAELETMGYAIMDLGAHDENSVDYPDFGKAMAEAIETGKAERGVLVCGTGIGISIAVNRSPNVRAAVCHNETTARLAREHNDANVLALGARIIGGEVAKDCLRAFLQTEFAGGRHSRRVEKLGTR